MKSISTVVVGLALLIALALIPGAANAVTSNCASTTQGGNGAFGTSPNKIDQVVLASNDDGKLFGTQFTETGRSGSSDGSGFVCGQEDGNQFKSFGVFLGNEDDVVRADGKGFDVQPGFGPVATSVDLLLRGGPGDDILIGHDGSDVIRGGSGDDVIRDPGGHDVIGGGSGDDRIYAKDGQKDVINCGGGNDFVKADPFDSLHAC